jgi:hypothetical protein
MLAPNPIFTTLTELATCLCASIEALGAEEPCTCGVVPGEVVAPDMCDESGCGTAWVRLSASYPANGVGVPNETLRNCGSGIGYEVELGVIRCVQIMEDDGSGPDAATLQAAVELQLADMKAMYMAINCCSGSKAWIVGSYTPIGPEGGAVGGILTVSMMEF